MEKIIVLGCGNGSVVENYNTCFALCDNRGDYFLVDAGGGNRILKQLKDSNIDINKIHDIFITHKHIDHLFGLLWIYRQIELLMNKGEYEGILNIYCHEGLAKIITVLIRNLIQKNMQTNFDKRIFINSVSDRERVKILDYDIEFFDIHAKGDMQYGFRTILNNGRILSFTGDEPLDESLFNFVRNSDYLLHEAFCLEEEATKFKARSKNHDTVAIASHKAEKLGIRNLILWHTSENLGDRRQELYKNEAIKYFHGNVYIPNDLDIIEL